MFSFRIAGALVLLALYVPQLAAQDEIAGLYISGGAGYGRSFSTPSAEFPNCSTCPTQLAPAKGLSGVVGVGYQQQFGTMVAGFEGRVAASGERGATVGISNVALSQGTDRITQDLGFSFVGSADVVIRLGARFDDFVPFIFVGGGIAVVQERMFYQRVTGLANAPQFPIPNFVGSLEIGDGAATAIAPDLIVGFGLDKYFGRWFVRGQAEIEAAMLGPITPVGLLRSSGVGIWCCGTFPGPLLEAGGGIISALPSITSSGPLMIGRATLQIGYVF